MVLENWLVAKSVHLQLCSVRCAQSQIPSSFHLWQNNTGGTREGLGSFCMSSWLSPFRCIALKHLMSHHAFVIPFHINNCGSCHNNLQVWMISSWLWLESSYPCCELVQGFPTPWTAARLYCSWPASSAGVSARRSCFCQLLLGSCSH